MNFSYVDNEMFNPLPCTHKQIRDLPDWTVECGKNGKIEKTYTAHVIARKMDRETQPQTGIELLYWVTEPGETPTSIRKYHSTSAMIRLKQKTEVDSITLYQGVENDIASLRLEISQESDDQQTMPK